MGKLWVEVCLISARGLRRTSSLWKLQWFAVGWIDPDNKYCTKIDASGTTNPVWKTRFSTAVDTSDSKFEDLALHVEVYSREPIFLRQSLLGTATIVLKEFLDKYNRKSEVSRPVEEVGNFELRKKNSSKPQGFVDISIRISEEREEPGSSYPGGREEFNLRDHNGVSNMASEHGSLQSHKPSLSLTTPHQPADNQPLAIPPHNSHQPSLGGPNYPTAGGGPSYQPPRTPTPPPPPPPSNVGYTPTFLPRTHNLPPNYRNTPPSIASTGLRVGPGFETGVGAGALAAGAMIFGDDFMSGFDFSGGLQHASVTMSTDPPL
ncbi:hypothetical protein Pfo_027652 [Paulownia fortunei]|nr:hypothetical protein Pfo_027652 [Paulownia fortunei]